MVEDSQCAELMLVNTGPLDIHFTLLIMTPHHALCFLAAQGQIFYLLCRGRYSIQFTIIQPRTNYTVRGRK